MIMFLKFPKYPMFPKDVPEVPEVPDVPELFDIVWQNRVLHLPNNIGAVGTGRSYNIL
jgi:hypothetical protein